MSKYIDIINANEGITKIANMDLNIRDAYKLAKFIKKLNEESTVYSELREKIAKKFGEFNEEKGSYFIPEESREEVTKRMKELGETEIDLGEKLKITVPEGAKIDAVSLMQVEDLIDFVFEEEGNEDGN